MCRDITIIIIIIIGLIARRVAVYLDWRHTAI